MNNKKTELDHSSHTHSMSGGSYYNYPIEDGMSLVDLWKMIYKSRKHIFVITSLATILAIIYALNQPLVYRVNTILLKPSGGDVQAMTDFIKGSDGADTSSVVFDKFKGNLTSRSIQRNFFNKYNIIDELYPSKAKGKPIDRILREFSYMFEVVVDKNKVTVFMEYKNSEIATNWLNQFIYFVNMETKNQFSEDIRSSISHKILNIEKIIKSKKEMAKRRREDRISSLKEEAAVLQSFLNLEYMKGKVEFLEEESIHIYRKHLVASEIKVLEARVSDEPFIDGLRDLQEELTNLRLVDIDKVQINTATIDQSAYSTETRIKPKRRIIVSIGLVLGIMLGIFYAFFREFYNNIKSSDKQI